MDVGYEGLDWQVDEYSRARAGEALAATVQSRMARASVARVMERAMSVQRVQSPNRSGDCF
jgi:hypothetical protein